MGYEDEGEIVIKAYVKDMDLYLEVNDNGVGIAPEDLLELFEEHPEKKTKGSGIGMKNVQMRIQLYFNETYGVSVYSELDEGTSIVIHMPKKTMEEMEHEGKML